MPDEIIDPAAQVSPDASAAKAPESAPEPKTSEEGAKGADAKTAPVDYKLTVPDGSLLGQPDIERITAEAKAKGLSNEAAQGIVAKENEVVNRYHEIQMANVAEARATWLKDAKADKEIGGENFTKSVELAHRVLEKVSTPAFKDMLNATGFGDHPEVVRVFARLGKMMADDELVVAKTQMVDDDIATKMYPSMGKSRS